jgi:hypothetical protein
MSTAASTAIVPAADNAVYMAPSGELQLDVRIDNETVWLAQAQIAELFNVQAHEASHSPASSRRHRGLESRADAEG